MAFVPLFKKKAEPKALAKIRDFQVSPSTTVSELLSRLETTGFQASELAEGARILREMKEDEDCTVFLAFTANMVASGLRGVFAQLVKNGFADAVITTGGSIDHDVIKSFEPYLLGSFREDDVALHKKGINRIGNIMVPNERYELLEKKLLPVFKGLYAKKKIVSASELISEVSSVVRDENSFLYWCSKRGVPVFSPGLVDSALGLQLFFFKQDAPDFALDESADLKKMSRIIFDAKRTGALICGGGISKHFTIASNLLRGGLDYSVYATTATPFDGSLSGAEPREAKSWGKITEKGKTATVYGDATINLPLMVGAAGI